MKWQRPFTRELADQLLEFDIRAAQERHSRRLAAIAAEEQKPRPQTEGEKNEKYFETLRMRETGKTFKQIGALLGISPPRARARCEKAERLIAEQNGWPWGWTRKRPGYRVTEIIQHFLGVPSDKISPEVIRSGIDKIAPAIIHDLGPSELRALEHWAGIQEPWKPTPRG